VNPPPAVAHYPSFLNAIFDPDWVDYGPDKIAGNGDDNNGPAPALKPVFRAIGTSIIGQAGYLSVILQLVVFDKGTTLPNFPALDPAYGYPAVVVLQQSSAAGSAAPPAPSALTDFCTPLKTVGISYGVTKDNPDTPANEGGIPVRTLPSAGTQIAGITYVASQRDADGDGFENSIDPCPYTPDTVWNARDVTPPIEGDSDLFTGVQSPDGIPDSCDPTPYEPSAAPPANSPIDHDGDGFLNRGDNCPLIANPDQRDTDKNAVGEEVGDGIGDVCDLNPGTPDGAEIRCIRNSVVVVGGDPSVAFSGCLSEIPPVGAPTPTPIGGGVGGGTATPTPAATPIATPVPTPTPTAPAAGGETCDGQLATKVGTDASEAIFGTNGHDVIDAKGGSDVILGMGGDDIICAGSGGDLVVAGGGNDRVFGEGGGDLLLGGRGDDFLDGGAGFDHCLGGPGDDTLHNCERGPGRTDGHGDGNRGRDEGDRERNSSRGAFVGLAGAIY
jgi:hypothetical protein